MQKILAIALLSSTLGTGVASVASAKVAVDIPAADWLWAGDDLMRRGRGGDDPAGDDRKGRGRGADDTTPETDDSGCDSPEDILEKPECAV